MEFILAIILIFAPLVIVMMGYPKAGAKYGDLYQEKKNPKYPFSQKLLKQEINKNPILFTFKKGPMLTFLLLKSIFEHINDPELKKAQWNVRKYFIFFFLYAIAMMVLVATGILTIS